MARKSSGSKRSVVKRSTLGSYLEACRRGKRFVTPRKANQYVPNNGIKIDGNKSNRKLLRQAAERYIEVQYGHLDKKPTVRQVLAGKA